MRLNKSLFVNFSWLAASQGANFIVPLIIYPYLLRIIGIEKFGLVVFAQAVVTYFVYIVDYGFSISAVREISIHRNNPVQLSKVYNKLYSTKVLICLLCFTVLSFLTLLIPDWRLERFLFLSSFSIVVGQLLLPAWFFQGLEKMNGVAIINFTSKMIFAILLLLFIDTQSDYSLVNFYLGISQIGVGLMATVFIIKKYNLKPKLISTREVKGQIRENRSIFFSGFAVFVSNNSNLMILGFIADPVSVGYYGIVDKILLAIRAPAVLLYQTIFPRVCVLAGKSIEDLRGFLKNVTRLIYVTFIPLGVCVFFLSDNIIWLFAGEYLAEPSYLLRIVCFVPFLAALNIPATHTLLAYDLKRTYAQVTASSAMINITLNIILVSILAATGTAITVLTTEIFFTSVIFITLYIRHKQYAVHKTLNPF